MDSKNMLLKREFHIKKKKTTTTNDMIWHPNVFEKKQLQKRKNQSSYFLLYFKTSRNNIFT